MLRTPGHLDLVRPAVSGPAAGCVYNCRMGTSFFLPIFFFFGQKFHYFLLKKNGIFFFAASRLATISTTRWTGNKLSFKGALTKDF